MLTPTTKKNLVLARATLSLAISLQLPGAGLVWAQTAPAPTGTITYTTTWLGNTFGGNPKWVQKDGHSLAVAADGRCYVGATWDEARKGIGIYQNGDTVGQLIGIDFTSALMAVDDKYAFGGAAENLPGPDGKKVLTYGVKRWLLDGTPAPLVAGGKDNFFPIGNTWLAGASLYNGNLYVGDLGSDSIRVFDRETLREQAKFPCPKPFRVAVNAAGIWVLQRDTSYNIGQPAKILHLTLDGQPDGVSLPEAETVGATNFALSPSGQLLVAGPHSQILIYDVSGKTPRLAGTLGQKDGVWAGTPGLMADDKLLSPWGVGCDAKGNIYVLDRAPAVGGCTDLRAFSPDGKMLWQLVCNQFTDGGSVDPATDGADVYTRDEHYVMDYTKPLGQQAVWKGYTLDPKNDDGRLDNHMPNSMFEWGSPLVRRLDGRLYLYLHPGNYIGIFRKGPGEIFAPSGLIDLPPQWQKQADKTNSHYYEWPPEQPKLSRWIWRDKNGDGQIQPDEFESNPDLANEIEAINGSWVDEKGDIWLCGSSKGNRCMWHLPLKGFDAMQNPIYDVADFKHIELPDEFLKADKINHYDANRILYLADTDIMYLSGTSADHPKSVNGPGMGTEVYRYDDWSKPTRHMRWRIDLPDSLKDPYSFFEAMTVAGKYLFCAQRHLATIYVYDTATGNFLGNITPGPEIGGSTGWIDMPEGIQGYQAKDGTISVFMEDDYKPKVVVYRLAPGAIHPVTLAENTGATP